MKPKKCKGINKAHGYDGCGKDSVKRTYGLCPMCFWDWMQTTEAGKIHYKKQFIPRVERNVDKTIKKKEREKRESLKTIARLINDARVPFQKWIRLRDANQGCISCGTVDSQIWDAGHFFKAEMYTGLIFNEINVNKQCGKCNRFLHGNETAYREGLVKKYGEEKVRVLEETANYLRTHRFSREELKEIKTKYQIKLREWNK